MSDRRMTELALGPYIFNIIDSEQHYEGRIIGRTFKMSIGLNEHWSKSKCSAL